MAETNNLEQRITELQKQNEELTKQNSDLADQLEYYITARIALDKAGEILEMAMDGEAELKEAADNYDDFTFRKENEMARRENKIREDEKRANAIIAKAKDMKDNSQAYIKKEAEAEILKYKNKGIKILAGITAVYTLIVIVVCLI